MAVPMTTTAATATTAGNPTQNWDWQEELGVHGKQTLESYRMGILLATPYPWIWSKFPSRLQISTEFQHCWPTGNQNPWCAFNVWSSACTQAKPKYLHYLQTSEWVMRVWPCRFPASTSRTNQRKEVKPKNDQWLTQLSSTRWQSFPLQQTSL